MRSDTSENTQTSMKLRLFKFSKIAITLIIAPFVLIAGCAPSMNKTMPKSPALPPPPFEAPSNSTTNIAPEQDPDLRYDMITGGYAPTDLSDENGTKAKELLIDTIYKKYPTRGLVDKISAEVQVVAGLNYKIRVEMSGMPKKRDIFEGVVYMNLENNMEITSLDQVQGEALSK